MAEATDFPKLSDGTHPVWEYPPGTKRWRRMKAGDRLDAAPAGWTRSTLLTYYHPVTGAQFTGYKRQWWLCEEKC
jgi:hypothetical protein